MESDERNPPSLRNHALAAYERGDADAVAKLAEALRHQPHDGGLLIAEARARAALGDPQALDRLQAMLRQAPDWLDGHVALAQLRWEAGQGETFLEEFERALQQLPGHAGLWFRYMNAIAGSGDPNRAANVARRLRQSGGDGPALSLIEAQYAGVAGELARAEDLLAAIADDYPGKMQEAVRHRLRRNDADGAAALIDKIRANGSMDGAAWALAELTWRAIGDPRHRWLLDREAHIGVHDLPVGDEELERLAAVLRRLHHSTGQPLGQSVRSGTQTRGNLWRRGEPEIAALQTRLCEAVAEFVARLSTVEPGHPLRTCPEARPELTTGWSIRLQGGGHHVSHIHAHGVVSSACYIALPGTRQGQEGWLELGRPPADIPLPLPPLMTLEPRPGRLILFPSYLYHGTRPFQAGERLTVAFDVGSSAPQA